MKRRLRLQTVLAAAAMLLMTSCLQFPEKLPNPDEMDAVQDVVQDVSDTDESQDTKDVQDAVDSVDDVGTDASDVLDAVDTVDSVEPCIQGDECDDQNPCTVNDECKSDGTCAGSPVAACDDSIECTDDSCSSPFECSHTVKAGFCLVSGVCYVADAVDVGLFGQCVACKPDESSETMSPDDTLTCDDGSACTDEDMCSNGSCSGSLINCDDTNVCTNDSCDPATGCLNVNNNIQCAAARCQGLSFYAAAVCSDGSCPTVEPENCDDGNPCTTDTCSVTGCAHTPRNGQVCQPGSCELGTYYMPAVCIDDFCPPQDSTLCDDGEICTEDYCTPTGGCMTRPDNTKVCGEASCDGDIFRPRVVCDGGSCPAQNPVNCDDSNVCTNDSCTLSGCSNVANSDPCSDGNGCTVGDTCVSKVCKSGSLKTCNDDLFCTSDSCNSLTGECVFTNLGYCIIDGACHMDTEVNPENTCQKCTVALNQTGWSPGAENSVCDTYPWGTARCADGECTYGCDAGRGNCDNDWTDGCEIDLASDPNYCGDCETACGAQVCSHGACADTCAPDLDLCAGRCIDTDTSLEHCGECGVPCMLDNAVTECDGGTCLLTDCVSNYFNIDGLDATGCECHSTGIELCDGFDNDCNGTTDDVAPEMLLGDYSNCNACGNVCLGSLDHSMRGFCSAGNCYQVACDSNTWDINLDPTDFCEYICTVQGEEACGNSIDEDCDGDTDEGC